MQASKIIPVVQSDQYAGWTELLRSELGRISTDDEQLLARHSLWNNEDPENVSK